MKILDTPTSQLQRVAFYGPMGSGKTWCANYLEERGYEKYALAAKLKEIAKDLFEVRDKSDRSRKLLQDIGMEMRAHDENVWVKYLLNSIRKWDHYNYVVIDDLRYRNEEDWLLHNGFYFVLVTCDERVRQDRLKTLYPDMDQSRQQHASEQDWVEIKYDFVIDSTYLNSAKQLDRMLENVTSRARWEE